MSFPTTRHNEYFVPRDGIDREVISADICRYLGNDALVRPGHYEVRRRVSGRPRCHCTHATTTSHLQLPSLFLSYAALLTISREQNPQTGQVVHGYYITAYRNLTTVSPAVVTPALRYCVLIRTRP